MFLLLPSPTPLFAPPPQKKQQCFPAPRSVRSLIPSGKMSWRCEGDRLWEEAVHSTGRICTGHVFRPCSVVLQPGCPFKTRGEFWKIKKCSHFIITLMRHCRNGALVYLDQPVVKWVSFIRYFTTVPRTYWRYGGFRSHHMLIKSRSQNEVPGPAAPASPRNVGARSWAPPQPRGIRALKSGTQQPRVLQVTLSTVRFEGKWPALDIFKWWV